MYVVNADGSEERNVTRGSAHVAWSPDGRELTFVRGGEIYVVNADGSGQRNLTRGRSDSKPAWSPDGRKIAFASRRTGNFEIYVMNADGSGQRNLTRRPGDDVAPAWSPEPGR